MRAPAAAEAIGEIIELLFVDLLHQHADGTLYDLVLECRFSDGSLAAIIFGQPRPLDGRLELPPAPQTFVQVTQVLLEVLGIFGRRHPVASRRTGFVRPPVGLA